ncbi:MAG: hypothetical protein GC192_23960 [Bacteroidetes bacterium]|nr:hypothetical protein [Bacteroidota bacterium]
MENTFFNEVFSCLNNAECKLLAKYVASPYFTGRSYLLPLLEYFIETRQQGGELSQEIAWKKMYPNEAFDDQRWRLALSNLLKLTEGFLSSQEMAEESGLHRQYLAQALRKKGLSKHYLRNLQAWRTELEQHPQRSADFYEKQYRQEWEHYRFLSTDNQPERLNLQEMSDAMDAVYFARKLRHACFSLSHQAIFKAEYRIELLDEILVLVKNRPALLAIPAINLYYHCYIALTVGGTSESAESRETSFQEFKQLLFELGGQIPDDERRSLTLLAINFGIRQLNSSRPEYDRPVLDLYQLALENGLLLENGALSRFAYNNIVAIALRLGDMVWVENFIHEFKPALERQHREITYSLSLARLEYTRKNYREALLHLQVSDYRHPVNNILAKTLQMKIYFETNELEALEAHLRNMKTYIRRQRSFGYHKENFMNIINFTQALLEINPFDKNELENLRAQIEVTEPLTERVWLLEMVGEK